MDECGFIGKLVDGWVGIEGVMWCGGGCKIMIRSRGNGVKELYDIWSGGIEKK